MPPQVADSNPYNVFRPRERVHRPQTRRRRENDSAAFNRLRNMRINLDTGRAILEWLQRREKRKRDILQCEMEMQTLQLRLRHDPKQVRALHGTAVRSPLPDTVCVCVPHRARCLKLQPPPRLQTGMVTRPKGSTLGRPARGITGWVTVLQLDRTASW